MKPLPFCASGCLIAGLLLADLTARANVYATDIKVNGSFQSITNAGSSPVTITYRLNEPATLGVTVALWQGATNVATIAGGTAMGLNTVVWGVTNNAGSAVPLGAYSLSITAAASGFPVWQQISVDANSGMPAFFPLGIAVDNKSNSPFYGRVVMSCALSGNTPAFPPAAQMEGLYKMNADGSQADEGWFGNANYLEDDFGDAPISGQMANASGLDPMKIRIGDDDRIYWIDDSYIGAIVACDMQATTNQLVINKEGYFENPDIGDLNVGIQQFDVTSAATTNAALWLGDGDVPNWGIWLYHLTNGAANPADNFGVQVVQTGNDLALGSAGGCMVDAKLDVFIGENAGKTAVYNAMVFTNWNKGLLPPPDDNGNNALNFAVGGAPGEVQWGYGCGVDTLCSTDPTFEAVQDIVINSRVNPTLVACPMAVGGDNGSGGGIRILNAADGSVVTVTNGAQIQVLTNLDWGHAYTCAAWDNVGNLYAASTNLNLWRVWSPPGPNTNTTLPGATVAIAAAAAPIRITAVSVAGATVTINFTASAIAPSAFTLQSSLAPNGVFAAVPGATVTGSAGAFSVSTPVPAPVQFYRIAQ